MDSKKDFTNDVRKVRDFLAQRKEVFESLKPVEAVMAVPDPSARKGHRGLSSTLSEFAQHPTLAQKFDPTVERVTSFMTPEAFNGMVAEGKQFKDYGASQKHGPESHRLQWAALASHATDGFTTKETETGKFENPIADIYKHMGAHPLDHHFEDHPEFTKTLQGQERHGLWDHTMDRANPHTFGNPSVLYNAFQDGHTGLPVLEAHLQEKARGHRQLEGAKTTDGVPLYHLPRKEREKLLQPEPQDTAKSLPGARRAQQKLVDRLSQPKRPDVEAMMESGAAQERPGRQSFSQLRRLPPQDRSHSPEAMTEPADVQARPTRESFLQRMSRPKHSHTTQTPEPAPQAQALPLLAPGKVSAPPFGEFRAPQRQEPLAATPAALHVHGASLSQRRGLPPRQDRGHSPAPVHETSAIPPHPTLGPKK